MRVVFQVMAFSFSIWAGSAHAVTVDEILEICADYPNGALSNTCAAYIASEIEILNSTDQSINPKGKLCVAVDNKIDSNRALILFLEENEGKYVGDWYDAAYQYFSVDHQCAN